MARRKQLFHPDDVKKKIQTSQLINRLQDHALSDQPLMDNSQVNAAFRLISKVIPDLKAVEISGNEDSPLAVQTIERVIVTPDAD